MRQDSPQPRRRTSSPSCAALVAALVAAPAAPAAPVDAVDATPSAARDRVDDARQGSGLALTGFIAEHVVRDPEDGLIRQLTRVEFSVHGRRITQLGGAGERILINHDLERLWLIDRRRRVVHQVPLTVGTDARGSGSDAEVRSASQDARPGHVFDLSPCSEAVQLDAIATTWRGRPVTLARCVDGDGTLLSTQTFDAEAGVVVRIERTDGGVEELRGIEPLSFGPDHFLPSPTLREVGVEELLGGAAPVARYEER